MLSSKELEGFGIEASDGAIGKVRDTFFDDEEWALRYLVVSTGPWLAPRSVLISPLAVAGVDQSAQQVRVHLTREQVKASPHVDTDQPVSRQHEVEFLGHYSYAPYWRGPLLWGSIAYPGAGAGIAAPLPEVPPEEARRRVDNDAREDRGVDAHLRSSAEVRGYAVAATDGSIGHVEDFLFDPRTWAIRYVLIDTRNWLPGRHVIVPPEWIDRVSWPEQTLVVNVTREQVKASPEYKHLGPLGRDYEQRLYAHYGRRPPLFEE